MLGGSVKGNTIFQYAHNYYLFMQHLSKLTCSTLPPMLPYRFSLPLTFLFATHKLLHINPMIFYVMTWLFDSNDKTTIQSANTSIVNIYIIFPMIFKFIHKKAWPSQLLNRLIIYSRRHFISNSTSTSCPCQL